MNAHPTRAEALALWERLADAGYTVTITSITHENMVPKEVFQLFVGPRRMRFTLDELLEVREMLPEGYTLSAPWNNETNQWQVVTVR